MKAEQEERLNVLLTAPTLGFPVIPDEWLELRQLGRALMAERDVALAEVERLREVNRQLVEVLAERRYCEECHLSTPLEEPGVTPVAGASPSPSTGSGTVRSASVACAAAATSDDRSAGSGLG